MPFFGLLLARLLFGSAKRKPNNVCVTCHKSKEKTTLDWVIDRCASCEAQRQKKLRWGWIIVLTIFAITITVIILVLSG